MVRGRDLPRKELHEAAEQLTASQAGLIVVGEPTIEQGLDKALTKAAKVVKRTVEATTDELTSELAGSAQRLTMPQEPRPASFEAAYSAFGGRTRARPPSSYRER